MVVGTVWLEFPFVNPAAAPLGLHPVFGGEVFGEQLVDAGNTPVERKTPLVAELNRETGVNKTLPVVGVVNHMPDCPLSGDIRHHPVESETIARLLAVFRHGLGTRADISAVGRQKNSGVDALAAEQIDDVGGLSPVGVDESLFDFQHGPVLALPLTSEVIPVQSIQRGGKRPFEARLRECGLDGRVRVRQRELPPMLVRPRSLIDHRPGEIIVPRDHHVEQ